MHYTYVLLSERAGRFYTGYTADLRKRIGQHQRGRVRWTAPRQPVGLIYYEACLSQEDALRRERLLRGGKGKRYLRSRLKVHLSSVNYDKLERY